MAKSGANKKPPPLFLQLFLIVINYLFLLMGFAIVALGIYFWIDAKIINFSEVFAGFQTLRSVRLILIACGSFIFLIALCGFLGAYKENKCLIILYILLCTLIIIGNAASVVMAFMYKKQVKSFVSKQIKNHMARYYGGNDTAEPGSDAFTKGIDDIQKMRQCCGWSGLGGVTFFNSTPWFTNNFYPNSCCTEKALKDLSEKQKCVQPNNEAEAREGGYMHKDDCLDKLMTLNSRFALIVMGSLVLAILLQIICVICSIVMASHM